MKQISYYATVLALSTLLLRSGYENRNCSHLLAFFSFFLFLLIASITACRSKGPAWLTIVKTIVVFYTGPFICLCIYLTYYCKMINNHVANILIVLCVALLGQLLRSPPDAGRK